MAKMDIALLILGARNSDLDFRNKMIREDGMTMLENTL